MRKYPAIKSSNISSIWIEFDKYGKNEIDR